MMSSLEIHFCDGYCRLVVVSGSGGAVVSAVPRWEAWVIMIIVLMLMVLQIDVLGGGGISPNKLFLHLRPINILLRILHS